MGLFDNMPFFKKKDDFSDLDFGRSKSEFGAPEPLAPLHNPALPENEAFPSAHGFEPDQTPLGAPLSNPSSIMHDDPQTSAFAPRMQQPMSPPGQNSGFTINSYQQQQPGYNPQQQGFQQSYPQYQPVQEKPELKPQDNLLQKDMEIISMKLDFLKAQLENISERLANLEHGSRKRESW